MMGTDDKEAYRHASDHLYFISRGEFQNLHDDVKETKKAMSDLCGDMKVVKQYIENKKTEEKQKLTKWGLFIGAISVFLSFLTSWFVK